MKSLCAVLLLSALACAGVNKQNADQDTGISQQIPAWSVCIKGGFGIFADCPPGGTGTPVGFSLTFANPSPSKDGSSMKYGFTSAVGGDTNGLVTYKAGADDLTAVFLSDFWFYSADVANIGQFEFDTFLFSKSENIEFMFGTQCNKTSGKWQIWGNGWIDVAPTLPCSVTASAWHHVIETFHRIPGDRTGCAGPQACMYFDRITIDDVPHDIGMKEPAAVLPVGWASAVGFQFQINIPGVSKTAFEYVDLANFSALEPSNQCQ